MTLGEGLVTVFVAAASGGLGTVLVRWISHREDRDKTMAEAKKALAEAAQIEGASWADLLKQYREEVLSLRREVAAVREDYDVLDDHVGTLERIMRRSGLEVPDRPQRKAV